MSIGHVVGDGVRDGSVKFGVDVPGSVIGVDVGIPGTGIRGATLGAVVAVGGEEQYKGSVQLSGFGLVSGTMGS